MAKRTPVKTSKVQVAFEALSIEGGILSPEWLSKIAQLQADAQTQADYKIPKGLTLRDEIGRYWRIAEALWCDYRTKSEGLADATKTTEDFLTTFFRQCLGFDDLQVSKSIAIGERVYPVGHSAGNGQIPIVISSPHESLDTLVTRFGEDHRKRTAFGLLQEYLNGYDKVLWGIVCDGETLRIVRDNASLTKPAWIEADLKRMFQEARFADFAAFWLICHRSRFGEVIQKPSECVLERWRNSCRTEGTRARDHLRVGVEEALEILGQGFIVHPENTNLREILQAGSLSTQVYFQELLRLVYRIIFLVTIEERGLLHPAPTVEKIKELYAAGYSIRRLRDRSIRRTTFDRFSDLWESLKIVFKGIGIGEERLGLPALGGLFGNDQTPTLIAAKIENRFLLQAVLKLCWLKEEAGVSRVNWRDMGPEELGSVYESLLELVPQVTDGGRKFSFARGDETVGNARKLSGSYYTPDELVQSLLDTALEPVVSSTIKKNINDPVPALLALTIIDPACGSAHFLLAAARRLAGHVARLQVGGTPSGQEYRKALRQVIGHCIYGVDKNPMALELARMALWLESMTPDSPLSFLDHHLVCGDALLGLLNLEVLSNGVPKEAFTVQTGDDKEVCKSLGVENAKKLRQLKDSRSESETEALFDLSNFNLIPMLQSIESMSDETPQAIELKKIALENYLAISTTAGISVAADMYVCAFLAPKKHTTRNLIPTTDDVLRALRGTLPRIEVISHVRSIVSQEHTLHWKLKFPQVFSQGGFDVVLANPPYIFSREQISEYQKNYLESSYSDSQYQLNTYLLFLSRGLGILRNSGRLGYIVPDSLLMIGSAAMVRRSLLQQMAIEKICLLPVGTFKGVNLETIILCGTKQFDEAKVIDIQKYDLLKFNEYRKLNQSDCLQKSGFEIRVHESEESANLTEKIRRNSIRLGDIADVRSGLMAYEEGKGDPPQSRSDVTNRIYDFETKVDDSTFRYLEGTDVSRFLLSWSGSFLKYGKNLASPRTFELFSGRKIIIREIAGKFPFCINASYTEEIYLFNRSNIGVLPLAGSSYSLKYILGVLNSPVLSFYFLTTNPKSGRKLFPKIIIDNLRDFPIPVADAQTQYQVENVVDQIQVGYATLIQQRNFWLQQFSNIKTFDKSLLSMLKKSSVSSLVSYLRERENTDQLFSNEFVAAANLVSALERQLFEQVSAAFGISNSEQSYIDSFSIEVTGVTEVLNGE